MMFNKSHSTHTFLLVALCLLAIVPTAFAKFKECCCCHADGCQKDNCVAKDNACCRRRLVEAEPLEKCADQKYHLSLVVEGHLSWFAEPELSYMGCPSYQFHAEVQEDGAHNKMMEYASVDEFKPEAMYRLGKGKTFTQTDIIAAYEMADPEAGKFSKYDIVTNNCASFVIGMAAGLNVRPTMDIIRFTANRLTEEAADEIMGAIRESPNGSVLMDKEAGEEEDKKIMMEKLVTFYVHEHADHHL